MLMFVGFFWILSFILTIGGILIAKDQGFSFKSFIIIIGLSIITTCLSIVIYKSFDYEYETVRETYISNRIPELKIKSKKPVTVTIYKKKCPNSWSCMKDNYIYKIEFDDYVWED